MADEDTLQAGSPAPFGVTQVEDGLNFALYSKHATSVELLLFAEDVPEAVLATHSLVPPAHKTSRVWHTRLSHAQVAGAQYYAYRVDGPATAGRFEDHAFVARKLLLDPMAREVYFPPGFTRAAGTGTASNLGRAPLGVLPRSRAPDPRPAPFARVCGAPLFIYEMHVRGFTRSATSGVAPERRGTYLGIVDRIDHLRELGVNAVELMPVHQFDPDEGNYWGYMTLNFFAPHQQYATEPRACRARHEFRQMVDALHAAGIEVILDVVYNHTTEAGVAGPTYSFKGLDNSTYYIAGTEPGMRYADFSGTGNTLHAANRAVRKLVMDSLRYWVTEMGVDGFRFDLGSVFARRADGTLDPDDPPIFGDIAGDPALANVRLIAEPWDAGGAYQLGRAFPGLTWRQWNGRFRDEVRRFVRGDNGLVGPLMTRLYGSDDLFPDDLMHASRPWQSVNYVGSHDGFTLYDLVAYDQRRNHANGHGNTDGPSENYSWNCGHEGEDGAPGHVEQLRRRQARNFIALLCLANGTPMLRMGDEFLHTQRGNSNPYNQDNDVSWLDWDRLESERSFFRFVRGMIAFRKAHSCLQSPLFWRDRVSWHGVSAAPDLGFFSQSLALCIRDELGLPRVYACINAWDQPLEFTIAVEVQAGWRVVCNTASETPRDFFELGARPVAHPPIQAEERSIIVLESD